MNQNGPRHAHGAVRRVKTSRADATGGPAPLGLRPDAGHRVAGEAAIVQLLLTHGWFVEVGRGERAAAESEARATLDRFVERGLGFERSATGERCFDPAEVTNFAIQLGHEQGDHYWPERCVPASRLFVWQAHGLTPSPGSCAPTPTALGPRRFTVRLSRRFNLRGLEPGASTRLRLPLPIEDAALGDLDIEIAPTPGLQVDYARAEARLDARLKVPVSQEVELGFTASFIASPSGGAPDPAPLDAEALALYSRPREGLIAISPPIRRLAAELAGGETDPWRKVERFWDFLFDRLMHGVVNYDEVDAERPNDWTLDNGWTDCQLEAALLAALCRAQDIPARLVGGYVMSAATPFRHYWVEVWIAGRGWLPLDLHMSWGFAKGGREAQWRDYYRGRLDYRMKTECLPRLFSGAGAIRLPPFSHQLSELADNGLDRAFYNSQTGALVYCEKVAVVASGSL